MRACEQPARWPHWAILTLRVQGRAERHAAVGELADLFLGHEIAVLQPVDAGIDAIDDRLAAAGMRGPRGLPSRCASSTITASSSRRNAGTLPPPGDRIEDSPLAAIFTRSTPFFAWARTSVSTSCTSLVSAPTPDFGAPTQVGIVVGQSGMAGQVTRRRGNARPLEHAGLDGVAHRDGHVPAPPGIADRRHARTQDLGRRATWRGSRGIRPKRKGPAPPCRAPRRS